METLQVNRPRAALSRAQVMDTAWLGMLARLAGARHAAHVIERELIPHGAELWRRNFQRVLGEPV